jgi:hypothetical protein
MDAPASAPFVGTPPTRRSLRGDPATVPNPEIIRRLGLRTLADAPSQNSWPFLLAMGALTLVGVALLPFAAVEFPHAPGFNLVYVTLVISGDLATAFLLFGQFTASGRPPILILAGAYLLTSLLVLSHLLYFARVMPETGPFPRAPQSAAWMWHFWHLAFPAAALAFAVSERWRGDRVLRRTLTPTLLCVAVVLLATALLNIVATRFAPHLPQLHDGVVWNPITFQLGWTMAGLTAAALAALLTLRDAQRFVHSWLGVALVAFLFDIALNMLALERYNLGWYAGRVSGVIAATFLLAMLIVEINLLYRALAASASRLGEFNARLEARVTEQTSQLTASNTELAGAVRQRDTLLHELNHRVNNNMNNVVSMIQLEGARSDNEETRSVMARSVLARARHRDGPPSAVRQARRHPYRRRRHAARPGPQSRRRKRCGAAGDRDHRRHRAGPHPCRHGRQAGAADDRAGQQRAGARFSRGAKRAHRDPAGAR